MRRSLSVPLAFAALAAAGLLAVFLFTSSAGAQDETPPTGEEPSVEAPAENPQDETPHRSGRPDRGDDSEAAATALDMTVEELQAARDSGQTLAELATDRGVDVQVVIDAIVAEKTQRIEAAVTAGDLTREQADEKLAALQERVAAHVNGEMPEHGDEGAEAEHADEGAEHGAEGAEAEGAEAEHADEGAEAEHGGADAGFRTEADSQPATA